MSGLLFGEIVEPSTRALIDEDLEEYPDYLNILPEWEGNYVPPKEINSIVFLESKIVKDLVHNCVLLEAKYICKLINGGIEIFTLPKNRYLVLYSGEMTLNSGQVVEALEKWICAAKAVYAITSDSIYNYQNHYYIEKPVSLTRILTNSENNFNYGILEQPNLVTGLGANILSYCIHLSLKKCTLFIIYMDKSPLDSYSSTAILNIFKQLDLPVKSSNIKISLLTNNLYM